jgi:hypothetical protein
MFDKQGRKKMKRIWSIDIFEFYDLKHRRLWFEGLSVTGARLNY